MSRSDKQFLTAFGIWVAVIAAPLAYAWQHVESTLLQTIIYIAATVAFVLIYPIKAWLQRTFTVRDSAR